MICQRSPIKAKTLRIILLLTPLIYADGESNRAFKYFKTCRKFIGMLEHFLAAIPNCSIAIPIFMTPEATSSSNKGVFWNVSTAANIASAINFESAVHPDKSGIKIRHNELRSSLSEVKSC